MGASKPDPQIVEAEQRLRDRESDQFGVGQHPSPGIQLVIDLHVQRGQQGVQVTRHTTILDTLFGFPGASSGGTATWALRSFEPSCGHAEGKTADQEPGIPQHQRP